MTDQHRIDIAGVRRDLPIREVSVGVRVALFDILGDTELTEVAGIALAKLLPKEVDALIMPEGKALALLHVVSRESGLTSVVGRKERKPYMEQPVFSTSYRSVTTDREQTLYLGADAAGKLRGKKVAFVDDVVSSGGTLDVATKLVAEAGGELVAILAVFTEGTPRSDIISLGHLPLF